VEAKEAVRSTAAVRRKDNSTVAEMRRYYLHDTTEVCCVQIRLAGCCRRDCVT